MVRQQTCNIVVAGFHWPEMFFAAICIINICGGNRQISESGTAIFQNCGTRVKLKTLAKGNLIL